MAKRKMIVLRVNRGNDEVFKTFVGSPDIVVGFLSSLAVPQNEDVSLHISLDEIDVPDVKENG